MDRWGLIFSHGEEFTVYLQELMKQCCYGMDEALVISKPFVSSWAYFITRICESILGLTPIHLSNGEEAADESNLEKVEGVSEEIQRNMFKMARGLYTYCIKGIAAFKCESESGVIILKLVSEHVMPSDPALAKVIAGCCDYLLGEHLELVWNAYRDLNYYTMSEGIHTECEGFVAVNDVKAFKSILDAKEDKSAETTSEDVEGEKLCQILKDRYASISWFYACKAVENDEELSLLWKRLGLDANRFVKFTHGNQNHVSHREVLRNAQNSLFTQYGAMGIALKDELAVKLSPLTYQDAYEIAMKLPIVDKLGGFPDEDHSLDSGVIELLDKIRGSSDGAVVEIDLEMTVFGRSATLFQVLAALVYQCHIGAIAKINCTGKSSDEDAMEALFVLTELFPNHLSSEDVEFESEEYNPFDEYESMSFQYGNHALIALTLSGKLPKFAPIMPSLAEEVNHSYIAADVSGLDDEDQLGMLRAVHIAACKSDLDTLKALIEVLHANVNVRMFDDSNALLCAIAKNAGSEIIQYLVDRGSNVNKQIFDGPGWQSNMTRLAGFSPLIMAVNNSDNSTFDILVKAGADPELRTGPLEKYVFPISCEKLTDVYEYEGNGFRFTALHIATLTENKTMVEKLITDAKANPDSRVALGINEWERIDMNFTDSDTHPFVNAEHKEFIEMFFNTPLHIAEENSETALALIENGASLLAQNIALETVGHRHSELLSKWLQSKTLNLKGTVVAVCQAKNVPTDIALYITEFYISLHLGDHFERAYRLETSDGHWPWMALALTYHLHPKKEEENREIATAWSLHRQVINNTVSKSVVSRFHREFPEGDDIDATREFVHVELKKAKGKVAEELLTILCHKMFHLKLFEDNVHHQEDNIEMNCEDNEERDEDVHVMKKQKRE